MAGIRIPLIADVKDWLSGTKRMGESLDDVADSLDDLARESKADAKTMERSFDDAGDGIKNVGEDLDSVAKDSEQTARKVDSSADKIEKSFDKAFDGVEDASKEASKDAEKNIEDIADSTEDMRKDVEKETDKLETSFREAFNSVKKESKDTGKDIGKGLDDGFEKGSQAAEEFRDESESIAKESATSFSGEFEDVADIIRDLLANSLVGFGPAGVVAGVAAAAGIGLVISSLEKSAEEAEEAKDRIISLADAINEVDGDINKLDWQGMMRDFGNAIGDTKEWWEPWQDEAKTNIEMVKQNADELGLSFQDLFQGMSGDSEAGKRALDEINEKIAIQQQAYEDLLAQGVDPVSAAHITQIDRLKEVRDELENNSGVLTEATELEELYKEGLKGSNAELQAQREELEEVNEQLRESRDEKVSAIEADIAFQETLAQTNKILGEGKATLDTSTEAGRENKSAMIDMANAAIDLADAEYEATGSASAANAIIREQKQAFIDSATSAGFNKEEVKKLADQLFGVPDYIETEIQTPGGKESEQQAKDVKNSVENIPTDKQVNINGVFNVPSASTVNSQIRTFAGGLSAARVPLIMVPQRGRSVV